MTVAEPMPPPRITSSIDAVGSSVSRSVPFLAVPIGVRNADTMTASGIDLLPG